jgi:hypothetical protein
MAIALAQEVAPGITVRAAWDHVDPEFSQRPGQIAGYFSKSEIARNERTVGLEKSIKAAENAVRALRRQMRFDDVLLEEQRLVGMREELHRLKTEQLSNSESFIVINRLLQDKSPGRQLATILHEVGHLLSYRNAGWEQVDPARTQQVGSVIGKGVGGETTFSQVLSGYPGIIRSVLDFAQQNGLNYNDILAEAKFLSRLWRLTETEQDFTNSPYRNSGPELIADVVSVSLHRPDLLQQYTPNLLKAMELFYEARPEVKTRVDTMNQMIASGKSWEYASHAIQAGFMRGEIAAKKNKEARSKEVTQQLSDSGSRLQASLLDRYQVLWNRLLDEDGRVRNAVQRLQFKTTIKSYYATAMRDRVLKPLQEAGMSEGDAGELFFYRRILLDPGRQEIFNALGFTEKEALEGFNRLTQLYDNDPRIFQALDEFHAVRLETVIKLMEDSGVVGDRYLEQVKSNTGYVRFDDLGHYLQSLERGYGSPDRQQAGKVLSDAEAARLKQIGSLGYIRNTLTATLERDLALYDNLLKTKAIRETLTAMIREGSVPVFRKSRFRDIVKHQPGLMKEYVEADFAVMSYPQRWYNKKTDQYHTSRVEYMVPKIFVDAFHKAPSDIQQWMAQVSNTSWGDVLHGVLAKGSGWAKKDRALVPLAKLAQGSNDFARAMMITFGGSFLVANLLSYDFLRTFVQIPRTNENIPFSGKAGFPIDYAAAFGDLASWMFQGKMHKDIKPLIEEGLFVHGRRYTEDMDNATLLSQIREGYGELGYEAKEWHTALGALGALSGNTLEAFRRVLTVIDTTAKLAAYRRLQAPEYSHLTHDQKMAIVREQVGSPAYPIRGTDATPMNMVFLFYSSIANAVRGDYRAYKRNPTMFVAEWSTLLIPTILMTLAKFGFFEGAWDAVFGDDEEDGFITEALRSIGIDPTRFTSTGPKAILETRTDLEFSGNWIIPLGMNKKGEGSVITFPLPQGPHFFFAHTMTQTLIGAAYKTFKEDDKDKEAREILRGYGRIALETITKTYEAMSKTQERATPGPAPWITGPGKGMQVLFTGNTASSFHTGKEFSQNVPEGERLPAAIGVLAKEYGVSKNVRNIAADDGLLDSLQNLFNPQPGATDALMTRMGAVGANVPIFGDATNRIFRSGNPGLTERVFKNQEARRDETAALRAIAEKQLSGKKLSAKEQRRLNEGLVAGTVNRDMLVNTAKKIGVETMDNVYFKLLTSNSGAAYPEVLEAAQRGIKDAQIALNMYNAIHGKSPDPWALKK